MTMEKQEWGVFSLARITGHLKGSEALLTETGLNREDIFILYSRGRLASG